MQAEAPSAQGGLHFSPFLSTSINSGCSAYSMPIQTLATKAHRGVLPDPSSRLGKGKAKTCCNPAHS
eukprot:1157540-Pelagomonas_calceolata.AAC.24